MHTIGTAAQRHQASSSGLSNRLEHAEVRQRHVEQLLREILLRAEKARKIILRDRERTDVEHIAVLLDTKRVYAALGINGRDGE
jgi:hypothetical protein